jgi:hypothetical protein
MINHHIQKEILDHLVTVPQARYADLKPTDMDGNAFSYHLHQLIRDGYIKKLDTGGYRLTAQGKAEGINNKLSHKDLYAQAHSILLLAVRDNDGRWLLRKRLVHPMYGRVGFVHAEPLFNEKIIVTAVAAFESRTGLQADFQPLGSGYIRIFQDDEIESFTHFTLMTASIENNSSATSDKTGENFWYEGDDFSSDEFVPSMPFLTKLVNNNKTFFIELEYHL